jgi:hypothetical protein
MMKPLYQIPDSSVNIRNRIVDAPLDRFLVENQIALHRIEPLNGRRHRIIIEHGDRKLAVSFQGDLSARQNAVLTKLSHAIRELAA